MEHDANELNGFRGNGFFLLKLVESLIGYFRWNVEGFFFCKHGNYTNLEWWKWIALSGFLRHGNLKKLCKIDKTNKSGKVFWDNKSQRKVPKRIETDAWVGWLIRNADIQMKIWIWRRCIKNPEKEWHWHTRTTKSCRATKRFSVLNCLNVRRGKNTHAAVEAEVFLKYCA